MRLFSLAIPFAFAILPGGRAAAADMSDLAEARSDLAQIEALMNSGDSVRAWNRDGYNRRVDQLALDLIAQLNATASELLQDADGEAVDRVALVTLLDRATSLALQRRAALAERAAAERATFGKFEQSVESDIARAFIEDLRLLEYEYLRLLVAQALIRRDAGLDGEVLLAEARSMITLVLAALTGQIRLDAMTIAELEGRRSDAPLDEELQKALVLVEAKQSRSLDSLEQLLPTAEAIGMDVAEQRGLLLRERGQLGVELLRGDVFAHVWQEEIRMLRDGLARNGANILFRALLFVCVLFLAWLLARLVRFLVRALLYRDSVRLSMLLRDILVSASSVVVIVAGIVVALVSVGVSLAPIFAGLGVLGIIVGLAVQDSLGNFAAGTMILIYRPFDVDDHIRVGGMEGLVKRMNLLATTISTLDNQAVTIPNNRIWGDTIVNLTANHTRRVDLKVRVAYREDPDRVAAVLTDLLGSLDYVLKKPEPLVHVYAMEDSSIAMMVKPWVRTADYWRATWDLNRQIKKRLDAEGIEIPFPQRVVTLLEPARDDRADAAGA